MRKHPACLYQPQSLHLGLIRIFLRSLKVCHITLIIPNHIRATFNIRGSRIDILLIIVSFIVRCADRTNRAIFSCVLSPIQHIVFIILPVIVHINMLITCLRALRSGGCCSIFFRIGVVFTVLFVDAFISLRCVPVDHFMDRNGIYINLANC